MIYITLYLVDHVEGSAPRKGSLILLYEWGMSQAFARRATIGAGLLALIVVGALASPASADVQDDLSDAEWYAMADDAVAEVEATDWAEVSAEEGCRLVDVDIREVVDEAANAEAGAPDDLAVPVVERVEVCQPLTSALTASSDGARTDGSMGVTVDPGSDCASTSGPGYLCISRSGGYVTTSWRYDGSGSVKAFLKLYRISASASGCPTGSTLATSSTSSYSDGTRRSLTVYAPSYSGYSSHVWKYVGLGVNTDWGSACGAF